MSRPRILRVPRKIGDRAAKIFARRVRDSSQVVSRSRSRLGTLQPGSPSVN
ncbi:unnamed protein product, partial [Didymodactylos carnosus]